MYTDVLDTIPEALDVDKIVGDLPGTIQDVLNIDQLTNVLDTDVLETIPEALDVDEIVGDLPGTIQDVLNTDQITNVLDTDVLDTIPEALDVDNIVGDLPGTIQDVLNTDQLTNALQDSVLKTIPDALDVNNAIHDLTQNVQTLLNPDKLTNNLGNNLLGGLTNGLGSSVNSVVSNVLDSTKISNLVSELGNGILPNIEDLTEVLQHVDLNGLSPSEMLAQFPLTDFLDLYKELLENQLPESLQNILPLVDPFSVVDQVLGRLLTYDNVGVIEEGNGDTDEETTVGTSQSSSDPNRDSSQADQSLSASSSEKTTENNAKTSQTPRTKTSEPSLSKQEEEKRYYDNNFDTIPRKYPAKEIDEEAIGKQTSCSQVRCAEEFRLLFWDGELWEFIHCNIPNTYIRIDILLFTPKLGPL